MESDPIKHAPDQIFSLDGESWQIMIGGTVYPDTYNSRGAALAGLDVEHRRLAKKKAAQNEEVLNETGPRGETWL